MMAQKTGRWTVFSGLQFFGGLKFYGTYIVDMDDIVIAYVMNLNWPIREDNAALMGAAPDLLEALESVEWTRDSNDDSCCPWCDAFEFDGHTSDCIRQRAIAKAGGA